MVFPRVIKLLVHCVSLPAAMVGFPSHREVRRVHPVVVQMATAPVRILEVGGEGAGSPSGLAVAGDRGQFLHDERPLKL